ncbi:glycosyltransferase family 2 protein [Marivita sp. GX14005]|uniref:glycosyltransferase family 2 protein n=1 Tax=Marivita sp. GX14005 TaxID=2942276 RepID=UPI002019AACC|nr:glycosyltransferase family 2 protein [Marivita sp. GX14005]MCL3883988.1 glycosyltransferase family 2 protein [Marivita sp. GX14005]
MTLITLSSIPPRFGLIGPTLESLVAQSGVDGVELTLPQRYRRFPDWDGTLPPVPHGVTIHRSETDYGPATKVLPAARRHKGQGVRLLLCDDDRDYRPGWAAGLLAEADRYPDRAVALAGWDIAGMPPRKTHASPRHARRSRKWDMAYRAARLRQILRGQGKVGLAGKPPRRIIARAGFADIFEGYGGVVLRPEFLDDQSFDIPPEAFHVDDVWLSGALARAGIGIWLAADRPEPKTTQADRAAALYRHREEDKGRAELDAAAIEMMRARWNIWGGADVPIPEAGARQM